MPHSPVTVDGEVVYFPYAAEFEIADPAKQMKYLYLATLSVQPGAVSVSAQRTPTIAVVTTNGTVALGSRKLTFIFSSDFVGTVLGSAFNGSSDSSVTIDAPPGDTLGAVAYTVSAGSMRIVKVV